MNRIMILFAAAMMAVTVPAAAETAKDKKEGSESAYEKLFKDKSVKTAEGFITLHKADDKVYAEIPYEVMGKDLMLLSVVSEISDHTDCHPGVNAMVPLKISFEKIGEKVNMTRDKSISIGDGDPNIELAIDRNNIGAVMRSFKIEAYNPDSTAVVVDLTDLMVGDERLLSPIHAKSEGKYMLMGITYRFSKEGSYLEDVKAFKNNVMITSTLTYTSNVTPTYTRYTTAKVDRMFVRLPETEMKKREADYRLPLQVIGKLKYRHDLKPVEEYYYALKWRLEPTDKYAFEHGEGSEVKKPIIFYVDTTFTSVLRAGIEEGIGEWNKAFEKIGFKNVIQFRDYPSPSEDPMFDPENFDYNVIRFVPSLTSDAYVRTFADPRSGEILRTTIGVCYNYIADLPFDVLLNTAHADPSARTLERPMEEMKEYIKNHFTWLAGVDCFGMTYNLTSSAAFDTDSLRTASFTQKYGTTPSMLDRALYNTAAPVDGALNGIRMTPTGLGEYDYFIVDWLYRPFNEGENEKEVLKKMVDEKVGNPVYRYEYAKNCPDCGADDVGNDDLNLAAYQMENLKYMMANFDKWVSDEFDHDYMMRTTIYLNLVRKYKQILTQLATNVYGIKTYQRMAGDPVPAYEYLPAERQKKALDMLFEYINVPDFMKRDDILSNMPMPSQSLLDIHNSYFLLLMNTIGGSLFAYDSAPEDRIGHVKYIDYQVEKLWEPTREGRELTQSELYFQSYVFRSLLSSTKMEDYKVKVVEKTEADKFALIDYSVEDKRALAEEYADALYAETYGDNDLISAAKYGELKRWPVFNVQLSRYVYVEQLEKAYNWMKAQMDDSDTETQQHYRFLTGLYERIIN